MPAVVPRRTQLLDAAADLFVARGYHAVGIDDIGAAAGISGPGVYRHFSSKQALLGDLCDRVMDRMLVGAGELVAGTGGGAVTLEALVDLHTRFAVGERALLGVWAREQRALPADVRRSLRARQREYEAVWHGVVAPLRPDLSPDESHVVVVAALALLNATALAHTRVAPERLAAMLRGLTLTVLLQRPA